MSLPSTPTTVRALPPIITIESSTPRLPAKRSCQNLYESTVVGGTPGWSASAAKPRPRANVAPISENAFGETSNPLSISLPSAVRSDVRQPATPIGCIERARARMAASAAGDTSSQPGQVADRERDHRGDAVGGRTNQRPPSVPCVLLELLEPRPVPDLAHRFANPGHIAEPAARRV